MCILVRLPLETKCQKVFWENIERLKNLIRHDILEAVQKNVVAGNITVSEGRKLRRVALQIYNHIYDGYEELEEAGVNQMAEEALILDIDIIEWEHKKEIERVKKELTEQVTEQVTKQLAEQFMQEKEEALRKLEEKLRSLGVSEEEIAALEK